MQILSLQNHVDNSYHVSTAGKNLHDGQYRKFCDFEGKNNKTHGKSAILRDILPSLQEINIFPVLHVRAIAEYTHTC